MSNLDKLTALAELLYGGRWVAPLSRELNVNPRTVRYWKSGEWNVTNSVVADLIILYACECVKKWAMLKDSSTPIHVNVDTLDDETALAVEAEIKKLFSH